MKTPSLRVLAAILGGCSIVSGPCAAGEVRPAQIVPGKMLLIRDVYPVETWSGAQSDSAGPFTLEHLLAGISRDGSAKTALLDWLKAWTSQQAGRTLPVGRALLDHWKKRDGAGQASDANWQPNFAHAPFRLLAIVYRPDLPLKDDSGRLVSAGEGRFVFCLVTDDGRPLKTTVNFEYLMPATTPVDAREWARRWYRLGSFPSFNSSYCKALAEVTNLFTKRGAMPRRPNGSALGQIRTNERDLSEAFVQGAAVWNLREFSLDKVTRAIAATTTKQTPRMDLAESTVLIRYINTHQQEIIDGVYRVPERYETKDFLGRQADVPNSNLPVWLPAESTHPRQVNSPEALRKFSRNTCNGCHGSETVASNYHIFPREQGRPAPVSSFLDDSADGGEMAERRKIMAAVLNTTSSSQSLWKSTPGMKSSDSSQDLPALLSKREGRVH